jgi:aminopeptidase N
MRVALALLAAVIAVPAAAQRLPGGVTPEHYTLWFAPDLERETFRGRAEIRVRLDAPASAVTLHAAEITFGEVAIEAGGRTQPATVRLDPATETATLVVPARMATGPATLRITYTGILNDKLRGFYLSKANGRKYAVSQMEATDARRAFPSFDEPARKATFDITLMIDAADTAISNGRPLSDTPGPEPGKHTIRFATTPKMSTYLVALLVGDFVCREGIAATTPIRVCATPDKHQLTGFALQAAEHQVQFFNDYFGIPYPFGKLDIVGIPDFAAGAMENAGAITFRERLLLADEATASVETLQAVAGVVAHEIAHQWFGNLVTMKWWDDIWLNEGFATWAANKPLAAWKPEWRMDVHAAGETQFAMGLDALRSTRAIRTKVETPAEINEVFDPIAYEKTSGVLNMIEAYVGPEAFRKGVSDYLKRYSSGNAAGEDFWMEMTRSTEKPVNRIMRSFVDQAGAPALSVRTRCVGGNTQVTVRQRRFEGAPAAGGAAKAAAWQPWSLPVCVTTGSGQPSCQLVTQATETFTATGCGAAFVNADARGYYFSEYEPEAVAALATRTPPLTAPERISLLGDEWRTVRAGRHDIGTYLDLAAAFAGDANPDVFSEVTRRLAYVSGAVADAKERDAYAAWLRATFRPVLDAIGEMPAAGDSQEVLARRGALWQLLGVTAGDTALQAKARTLAEGYLANPSSLPATFAGAVLQVAAAGGDAALYDRYLAAAKAALAAPEQYYRVFNALASFRDPALADRTIAYALSPDLRSQDTPTLVGQLLNSSARDKMWTALSSQWTALSDRLGSFQSLPYIVGSLGGFCTAERAAEIRAFFAAHPVPAAARGLAQSLERIDSCVALDQRQSAPFATWLAGRPKS